MKLIIVFFTALAAYLFFPTYDLVRISEDFSGIQKTELIEGGFISRDRCKSAAKQARMESFKCLKSKVWDGLFSNYRKYSDKPQRYDDLE